jgi:CheY-like chemotaxis protein
VKKVRPLKLIRMERALTSRLSRAHVLVADDDVSLQETLRFGLDKQSFVIEDAACGAEAIERASKNVPDLLFLDLRLPDMSGLDVVRALRERGRYVPFVLMSAWLETSTVVEAMRLGALDALDKPLMIEQIDAVIRRHVDTGLRGPARAGREGSRPVAERWADYVVGACDSIDDLKTLADWARAVAVSNSVLCETCRLLGIRPSEARDLMRVTRALVRTTYEDAPIEAFLDIGDRRTRRALMERAGIRLANRRSTPQDLSEFLSRQRFVDQTNQGLRALRRMLVDGNRELN